MIKNDKQLLLSILQKVRLSKLFDYVRYLTNVKKHQANNQIFLKYYPSFQVPPAWLAYRAYGHTNWHDYYQTGKEHASFISDLIEKNSPNTPLAICEWGCGTARILRHVRKFFNDRAVSLYGFDDNPENITWCKDHIEGITFKHSMLTPPLAHEADAFDSLYSVSMLTRLSKQMHFEWIKEISRVVKPNGIIILTTHGDLTKLHLLESEQQAYERGELVVRDTVEDGKRAYVAFHPPTFIRNELLGNFQVISHITNPIPDNLTQDIWVVRNTKN
jgi:SAM-dependent methyltransferase